LIQRFATVKSPLIVFLLIGIIFNIIFFNTNNFDSQRIYGHFFSADETASLVAVVDQVQVELELVMENLANNNVSLAQDHAIKAASLLSPKIMAEISEDQQIGRHLTIALKQLQNISSSSASQRQMASQLTNNINDWLDKATNARIVQEQTGDSSNILERGLDFLMGTSPGGGEPLDNGEDRNGSIQPLAFAELVDGILVNYGNAYGVRIDLTNMSNIVMIADKDNSSSMVMNDVITDHNNSRIDNRTVHTMNISKPMPDMDSEINSNYSLADISDYQSAEALSAKAMEIFNTKLKYMTTNTNYTVSFVSNLENGLTQLNTSIRNKASPTDIMKIVHSQIHPNLLLIFNLELR
jgi:hypothetical protein